MSHFRLFYLELMHTLQFIFPQWVQRMECFFTECQQCVFMHPSDVRKPQSTHVTFETFRCTECIFDPSMKAQVQINILGKA